MDIEEIQQGKIPEGAVFRDFVVSNRLGLHARPAAMLVKVTRKFESDVYIERDGSVVDGKSIMGVMMLGAATGSKLRFISIGNDAELMLEAISELFAKRFEEE